MHRRSVPLMTAIVTVLAVLLTGCGGGSSHHRADPTAAASSAADGVSRADAPQLKPLWTATAKGANADVPPDVLTADGVLVVEENRVATAISRRTGAVLWTRPAPCAEATRQGSGVVVMQTGRKCVDVQAVDLRTGKVRWTSTIQHPPKYLPGGHLVGVGRRVATVKTDCGAMERFDLASGRHLGAIGLNSVDCTLTTATDGRHIVVADRLPGPGEPALMEYDADTGRRVWARRATDAYTQLVGLVSSDPLVLDIEVDHHRLLRRYDAQGRPRAILGRQLPADTLPHVTAYGVRGGVLVGQYDSTLQQPLGPVYGWDLATGRTDWTFADDGYLAIGIDGGGFLASSYAATGPRAGGKATADTWIGERGPGSGDALAPVGWIAGEHRTSGSAVVGDLLLIGHGGKVTAYRLSKASDGEMPTPLTKAEPAKGWAAGDAHPKPGVDPCAAVSVSTLRELGFRDQLHLPTPIDCDWLDYGPKDTNDEVSLRVEADVSTPDELGTTSADEAARSWIEEEAKSRRGNWDSVLEDTPKPVAVNGVGDEAWAANAGSVDSGTSFLLVRSHNVVVEVTASATNTAAGWQSQPSQVADGAWQAASDVFTSLGIDVGAPPTGADGAVTSVRPACDLLRTQAARLVKGAKPHDRSQPGQQRSSACSWSTRTSDLTVRTYAAAPTALPLQSADQVAAGVYRRSRSGGPQPGLGDAATVDTYGGYRDESGPEVTVTARRDNLVVQVDYTAPVGTSAKGARAAGVRLAREALAQR